MFGTARLTAALLLFAAVVFPGPQVQAAGSASAQTGAVAQIDESAFQQMLEESTGKDGSVKTEDGDTLRVELAEESTVMFFTTPIHPAHPAVVSVKVMREEGVPHILTDGWRAGSRKAFDDWFTAFIRRNAALVRRWQESR